MDPNYKVPKRVETSSAKSVGVRLIGEFCEIHVARDDVWDPTLWIPNLYRKVISNKLIPKIDMDKHGQLAVLCQYPSMLSPTPHVISRPFV